MAWCRQATNHYVGQCWPRSKGIVTVLSPHPGSELCSADFDKYLPWSLGLYNPYIRLDIHLNSLGSIQLLTRNLAPRLTNMPSQVPICSWVERSNAAWSALLRSKTNRHTGRVLNPGLGLDPNLESCTLGRWTNSPPYAISRPQWINSLWPYDRQHMVS